MNTINILDKINTQMKSLRWKLSSFQLTNCPNTCLNGEQTVRNSPKFGLQIGLNHGQQRRSDGIRLLVMRTYLGTVFRIPVPRNGKQLYTIWLLLSSDADDN